MHAGSVGAARGKGQQGVPPGKHLANDLAHLIPIWRMLLQLHRWYMFWSDL